MCTEQNELKKAFLSRYLEAKKAEQSILLEMEELEGSYILPSKEIDGMPHGRGGDHDLSAFGAKYDELYQKLKRMYMRRMAIYEEIIDAIEAMPTGEAEKTVLRYRYIFGYKWEKIAVQMEYSYVWVCKLHGRALYHLKISKKSL